MTEGLEMHVAPWAGALLAVLVVSLVSLFGALAFVVRAETLDRVLPYVMALAVGALLGTAFLHMLPEVSHDGFGRGLGLLVLGGMLLFFALERVIGWHEHGHGHGGVAHGHDHSTRHVKPFAWLSLAGDGLHNFADGLILAAAWSTDPALGVSTTVAVALHEIPHELGNVSVLLAAGLSRARAVALNVLTAFTSMAGALVGLALHGRIAGFDEKVLAVTAGGFIYVAAADLMPELHRQRGVAASALQAACLLAGVAAMALVK